LSGDLFIRFAAGGEVGDAAQRRALRESDPGVLERKQAHHRFERHPARAWKSESARIAPQHRLGLYWNLIPSPQARLQICCIPVFGEIPWFFRCEIWCPAAIVWRL
jgi:hypothetical protein